MRHVEMIPQYYLIISDSDEIGDYTNTFMTTFFRREFWAARAEWEEMMKQPYMVDYIRVYQ